ncbi:MAG: DUF4416 family protein [Candidatus Omnitrophica bacterium]|nr:DUF4416 family protein [Candidatus Omnitrophota bacterium]MBU1871433.1 DUF4416 family protein [Candidatus Omnitrophota bacterium]
MGKIIIPEKVKLFIGLIYSAERVYFKASSLLRARFGQIDFESETLPFNQTRYYERELGNDLRRKFLSFRKLIGQDKLAKIKGITDNIEKKLSSQARRLINIDPGLLTLGKIILATSKDQKHRFYLSRGIYAEVALYYRDHAFRPWEWTYSDYRTAEYQEIFKHIRGIYSLQLKKIKEA